jgi:HSP20 family protein
MSLIRRNPYDPFYDLNRVMDHMRTVMNSVLVPFEGDLLSGSETNSLAVDMSSDENNIIVRTVLPGFKDDEVNIDVQGEVLTISAESKSENNNQQANWHIREMRYGKFSRAITLPEDVIADNAEASLENGILTVTLPKQKPSLAQKIAVKARTLLTGGNNNQKKEPAKQGS